VAPIQLWHGTNDTVVPYPRLNESIEQWTNVHGLSQTPTSTDTPQSGWTRRRYPDSSGDALMTTSPKREATAVVQRSIAVVGRLGLQPPSR
jgi:poly(3-hydroxybutyrate) depolymerase